MDTVNTEKLPNCFREVDSLQQKVCGGASECFLIFSSLCFLTMQGQRIA